MEISLKTNLLLITEIKEPGLYLEYNLANFDPSIKNKIYKIIKIEEQDGELIVRSGFKKSTILKNYIKNIFGSDYYDINKYYIGPIDSPINKEVNVSLTKKVNETKLMIEIIK